MSWPPLGISHAELDKWRRHDRARYLHHMAGGRTLEAEQRGGVTHFKPGQHHAIVEPWTRDEAAEPVQLARLTYVDQLGHLCVLLCSRSDPSEAWCVRWRSRHGQQLDQPIERVPASTQVELSAASLAAIEAAEQELAG